MKMVPLKWKALCKCIALSYFVNHCESVTMVSLLSNVTAASRTSCRSSSGQHLSLLTRPSLRTRFLPFFLTSLASLTLGFLPPQRPALNFVCVLVLFDQTYWSSPGFGLGPVLFSIHSPFIGDVISRRMTLKSSYIKSMPLPLTFCSSPDLHTYMDNPSTSTSANSLILRWEMLNPSRPPK